MRAAALATLGPEVCLTLTLTRTLILTRILTLLVAVPHTTSQPVSQPVTQSRPPRHPNPETTLAEESRHPAPGLRQVRATLVADQLDLLADWGGGSPAAAHALLERLHVCSRAWEAELEAGGAPKEEL